MSTLSTISGLPIPTNTDVIDADTTYGGYAKGIDSILVPRYASTSARDSANVSGATEGQVCAIAESGAAAKLNLYDGTTWNILDDMVYVVKSADTSRVSTAVVAADPHLTVTVNAPGVWLFESYLAVQSTSTAPAFRCNWAATGTATVKTELAHMGASGAGVTVSNTQMQEIVVVATDITHQTSTIAAPFGSAVWSKYIVDTTGSTAGQTLIATLTWAQAVSSATAVVLKANSYITARRLS
jgi:hypothetical protein